MLFFFYSTLEPDKDRVGDYTLLLAEERAKQVHLICTKVIRRTF